MAETNSQLNSQLQTKQRELDSVGNKLAGAGIGAALTKNPLVGSAAGAFLGRQKEKKAQLEREINEIKRKQQANASQISQLKTKLAQLQNESYNNATRLKNDMQQKLSDMERQRQNEQDATKMRELDTKISYFRSDMNAKEQANSRADQAKIAEVQRQIDHIES